MKRYFPKLYRHIFLQVHHRVIISLLLALIGLISALSIQVLSGERAISTQPAATQLICSRTPTLSPEQFSVQGRASYDQGNFYGARDCWQKAAAGFRQSGNETESINNQINQAQAEQALGLYPRACSTLLQIYGEQDCTTLLQQEDKGNPFFITLLATRANSPAKIAGLRSLGNVLRGLSQLNLSHQVFLLSLKKTQPQEQAATWLDLGITRRALSSKEQDLYSRSEQPENIICSIVYAYEATNAYQKAIDEASSTSDSQSIIKIQAQLNQLSFVLDLQNWQNKLLNKQTKPKDDVFARLFKQSSESTRNFLKIKVPSCWNKINTNSTNLFGSTYPSAEKVSSWLFQQLSSQNPLLQLQQINNLEQQIDQLPASHTALYARINFAESLRRISSTENRKIEAFLERTINLAEEQGNKRAKSYALGNLGKQYEDTKQWKLAKTKTQLALLLAQSIPDPDIMYRWQWQLGRIYMPESIKKGQAKAKGMQDNLKNVEEARKAYEAAFETLKSLRRELATGNSDLLFFLLQIEEFHRKYVDVLLWDQEAEPTQANLSQAREVITSLQAVEIENFLRQACPENNIKQIDKIIDEKAKTAAFVYPIVLDNRIEIILKLPTPSNQKQELKHFRKSVPQNFDDIVRQLQLDLEEEYTFEAVREEAKQMYQLLVECVDKEIEKYNRKNNIKIDTLVFVQDTNLRNIPLAALVINDNEKTPKYLIDKYAIALAPRLDIPTPDVLRGKKLNILAAGLTQPKLEYQSQFSKLNYPIKELDELKKISGLSVTELSEKDFNTNKFQSKINTSTFQILHIATHGQFSSSPEKTFILAYDKPIKVNEIGDVFRSQAQNQLEPIELLVLSACETASGDKRATLGISGVSVRAGARSSIASLWTLDDKISVDFTRKLYEQLLIPEQTKAQALRKAQIALRDLPGQGYDHPRYWAPYILLGNWLK